MGEFPSGQRGQTVNLLSTTSVVRIHSLPPSGVDTLDVYPIFVSIHAGLRAFFPRVSKLVFHRSDGAFSGHFRSDTSLLRGFPPGFPRLEAPLFSFLPVFPPEAA